MVSAGSLATPFSLYVHIPFCGQRCPYCDFNTYVEARIPEAEYTRALVSELVSRAAMPAWRGRPLQSIFFGGGTPSLFSPDSLGQVISEAKHHFESLENIEISIEANPGTVSEKYFSELLGKGVGRISLGAQTFNRDSLLLLGRAHSVDETLGAFRQARAAGLKNINLDLIYALPEQTLSQFEQDISTLIELQPDHISAYQLTIEKGTPFSFRYAQGELRLPPEDDTVEMMKSLGHSMSAAGFAQYEISNFARSGFTCRHNQAYWDGDDYLGIGAGAHSFNSREGAYGRRWSNFALPREYMHQVLEEGIAESWSDNLSQEALRFEFFFLGLRRTRGVSVTDYQRKFGRNLLKDYHDALAELSGAGLLTVEHDLIFLSERGKLLSDSVFEYFITPESAPESGT